MSSPEGARGGDKDEPEYVEVLADVAEETAELKQLAREILAVPEGGELTDEQIQRGITALCKIYTVHYQVGGRYPPFVGSRGLPPTVAMVMASQMLKAVNIELFELGMWQAWSRG